MRLNAMTEKPFTIQLLCKKTFSIILLLFLGCFFLSSVIPPPLSDFSRMGARSSGGRFTFSPAACALV